MSFVTRMEKDLIKKSRIYAHDHMHLLFYIAYLAI